MTDEKLKHKPQKKRTLEEVLKSLQDLIRTDLMSTPGARKSWHESADVKSAPAPAGDEPETLRDALQKLDKIITEKIIEPLKRAEEEEEIPPEPLLPDEEIEIEWNDSGEPGRISYADAKDEAQLEPAEIAALETITGSLEEEIEIEPLALDAAPPSQPATEAEAESPLVESTPEPPTEVTLKRSEPEAIPEPVTSATVEAPIAETIEIETAEFTGPPSEETVDLAGIEEPSETTDGQHAFDFTMPEPPQVTEIAPERSAGPLPLTESPPEKEEDGIPPTVEMSEVVAAPAVDDTMSIDLSAEAEGTAAQMEEERPSVGAVESSKTVDEFTVEFTVEPKTPPATDSSVPETKAEIAAPTGQQEPGLSAANHLLEESAVKKKSRPSDSPDAASKDQPPADAGSVKKPSEQEPGAPEAPPAEDEIPVLDDIADLRAPPSPPLPDASQARDIAIRVIAKLNIERRKAGELPLDIKTIERLHQYLADALSKRALNKLKQT